MKNQAKNNSKNSRVLLNTIGKLLNNSIISNIISGVIAGVIVIVIQKRTDLIESSQGSVDYSTSPVWLFVAACTTFALLQSLIQSITVYFNSQEYFREKFSLASLQTVCLLIIALAISVIGQRMFWYPLHAVLFIILDKKLTVDQLTGYAYACLFALVVLVWQQVKGSHQNWDGRKSKQQYQREQKSEPSGILVEGLGELKRILKREGSLEEHSEIDPNQSLSSLEQPEDPFKNWQDLARELLRLSSSSYVIEESGWHDKQGCWVGQNIDTEDLVFLYPAQSALSESDLNAFVAYAQRIANSKNLQIGELIVAFQEDGEKLATPTNLQKDIRFETEESLLNKLVNFRDYYNDIRKRVLAYKLPESELTLDDVYVPSLIKPQERRVSVESYLQNWLDDPGQRQVALLGEYGQGKSSAALMFTYRLLSESNPKRIPILIELRGRSPRNTTPIGLLGDWAAQYRIDAQALMRLNISGRLVLIFEGFDEMALIGNSEMRLRHFRKLWNFCYRNTKMIITGRPNFFLDDREMKAALGIDKQNIDKAYCEEVRLAPFTVEQLRKALRKQKPEVREQICSFAKSQTRFLDIVSRPSLLHVVSVLWEKDELGKQAALLSSAEVMKRFVINSYRRQGLKAQGTKDSKDFMALNSSERDYFMSGIASYMAENQLGNQIGSNRLSNLIDNLIECIPDSASKGLFENDGEEKTPLQQRIEDDTQNGVEHIKTDVRTCGLLVDDPSAPGTFSFGHKSFMEYLFAKTVKEAIWNSDSDDEQRWAKEKAGAIKKATDFSTEKIIELPESVNFLAETLGTNNEENNNFKNKTAIRLLKAIFNVNKPIYLFILRCFIFNYSYSLSRKKLALRKRLFILLIHQIVISFCFFGLMLLLALIINFLLKYSNYLFLNIFDTLLLIMLTFFSSFYTYLTYPGFFFPSQMSSSLKLWNILCKELKIEDKVLHEIAGTSFFPWAKEQTFDYFINEKSKSGGKK